jgi:hypothetical protein
MTLEITNLQRVLLLESLSTRLQRIEEMIRIFKDDQDTVKVYEQEFLDVEHLRQTILNPNNV